MTNAPSPEPINVSLITGFLGSGKTTLMRHLLRSPAMKDAAVIVNEFGEVGLDHQLMEASGQEVVLLESGCICCSLDGSLVETIENLLRQRRRGTVPSFRRILIETTGLADPGPVIHELFDMRAVRLGVHLDRVVTLVDAVSGAGTLDKHDVALRQVALANSILVSKTDLAKPETAAELLDRLAAINPRATLASVRNGEVDPGTLFPDQPIAAVSDLIGWQSLPPARDRHHHHGHSHHDRVSTVALRLTEPASLSAFSAWLDEAIAAYGNDLLRIKAILNVKDRPKPVVVHGVQRVFHPAIELEAWPDEDRSSRIVLILYDIEPRMLVRSLSRALSIGHEALQIVEDDTHAHHAH
jgi:G3E family GTPase